MKTSNLLLGLWVLLIAGLALIAVYFLRGPEGPPPGKGAAGGTTASPHTGTAKPVKPPRPPRVPVNITPKKPLEVTGRVLGPDGKAIAGAVVRLLPPAKAIAVGSQSRDMDEIRRLAQIVTVFEEWETLRPLSSWSEAPPTDPNRASGPEILKTSSATDGSFTLTLAPSAGAGPFRLTTRVDEIGSASASNVHAGDKVELVLSSGGVVTGRAISESDEAVIADARIVFDSGDREFSAVTDEKGEFRIEGMPPGRFSLRAGAKGRCPILDLPIQVVRGEQVVVKFPSGARLRIKAIVQDGNARAGTEPPIQNVQVVALEETTQVYVMGLTNEFGMIEFTGLPVGSWIVNGRVNGFVSSGDTLVKIEPRQEIVEDEVSFEPAVDTPLEVFDETGLPIAGVEFFTSDGADQYDAIRSEKLPGQTDSQGKWSFPFEFDGPRCMVYGFKKGYGLVHAYPDDYSAGDPVRLVLKKSVRVFGKVSDEQGTGVPNALVRLTIEPGAEDKSIADAVTIQVRSDAQGRYDFPYVPAGFEVTIEAESDDAWSDDMPTVEPVEFKTEYEVDLRLEAAAGVRGFETIGAGTPGPVAPAAEEPVKGK